jgi:FtsP/CotA-like multicopper oxidase with cupredoxin domain
MNVQTPSTDFTRREALQWSFGLLAGTTLAACGGSSATEDTLPDAPALGSANGVVSLELNAQYATQTMTVGTQPGITSPTSYPGASQRVATSLRSFNSVYMAPTLVVNIGDTLRIALHNKLPANVGGQSVLSYLNFQNSTNLHFHGLHVDPKEIRPGVFGDYMIDHPDAGVKPGANRQHEVQIPSNHTNGIYWYHPHLHGATNVQVSSGLFGAILIRDPEDVFITSHDIRERVIFVHKVSLDANGKTESFYDSLSADTSAFMLNGVFQPTIVMRPGEVQNWHFINAASRYPFNPVLDDHTLLAYARDGNVFNKAFKPIDSVSAANFDNQNWPTTVLYPGGRLSVVVKASSTPGTYYLRAVEAPSSGEVEIVARVVVEGAPMSTALPSAANLPVYADHRPITDAELAAGGGKQRNLTLAIVPKDDPRLRLPIPTGEEWFVPTGENAPIFILNSVFAAGVTTPTGLLAPFQSSLMMTQTVALNAVEEWTITNANGYPHPFHIHVNDSFVVRINGEAITPFWADTLPLPPNGSLTFRIRFTDFTGKYVWHCHVLDHEDMGMMELVEVVVDA